MLYHICMPYLSCVTVFRDIQSCNKLKDIGMTHSYKVEEKAGLTGGGVLSHQNTIAMTKMPLHNQLNQQYSLMQAYYIIYVLLIKYLITL